MIEKIYFTVLFVLALLFFGSLILMNEDTKREDTWYKTTLTILALLIIIVTIPFVGGMIFLIGSMFVSIWSN